MHPIKTDDHVQHFEVRRSWEPYIPWLTLCAIAAVLLTLYASDSGWLTGKASLKGYVSDGYGNNRVVKFTKDYKYVKAWGKKGTKPGEFNLPHCILTDAKGLLHVSDRENDRVQVFDQDGNYVRHYGGFAPFGLFLTPDQTLFVADGRAHKCLRMSLEGKVDAEWGSEGAEPGQFNLPHGIAVDGKGNVYVGEIEGRRVQKFVKR